MNKPKLRAPRIFACLRIVGLLLFLSLPTMATPLTARTSLDFQQTMAEIQHGLIRQGYKIVHIQKCDGALEQLDYKSDFYRVILFGKLEQFRKITRDFPVLVSLLPMRITIFAAGTETIVSAINPLDILKMTEDETLKPLFKQWHQDLHQLLVDVREQGTGWSE